MGDSKASNTSWGRKAEILRENPFIRDKSKVNFTFNSLDHNT